MDEKTIIELETKIAHHELAIDELQKTVFDQQTAIGKLEKTIRLLQDRFNEATLDPKPVNEKPPHY